MKNANDTSPSEPTGDPITRQIRRVLMVLLVIITVVVVGFFLDGRINGRGPLAQVQSTSNQTPSETANTALPASETASQTAISPSLTPTISPPEISDTPVPGATSITSQSGASSASATDLIPNSGTLFLSIDEGGYKHLFAYHPQNLPFTRMTSGTWDDIDPSISPDGSRLAFASSREGFWDIYILDISTGKTTRFTDTPEFDGAPAWSPDGKQIVFSSAMGTPKFYHANSNLAVIDAEGGTPRSITGAFDEQPRLIEWRGDGIYFIGAQKTASHLFKADPAGGAAESE